jgi:hypothetical protein
MSAARTAPHPGPQEKARELEEAKQVKQQQVSRVGVGQRSAQRCEQGAEEECTIRTNSPKFGTEGGQSCGQCVSSQPADERKEAGQKGLVVRAGQAGTELRSVGLAGGPAPQHLASGAAYQAKFNITVSGMGLGAR